MSKKFNCIYIHETINVGFEYPAIEIPNKYINSYKFIERFYNVFKLIKEDYIMLLEDDVIITDTIKDIFRYDLNGYCPNSLWKNQLIKLKLKYNFIDINAIYKRTGHGGSVAYKKNILNFFENKAIIEDIVINWVYYEFPVNVNSDFLISLIIILNKGTIGAYTGHADGGGRDISVQHQHKEYYRLPLPDNLKYLCKIVI
jgi:hypothetical protein